MKRKIVLLLITFFCNLLVIHAYETSFSDTNNEIDITYEEAKKIVKETMRDWYIRGPYVQYNYSRSTYGVDYPENATKDNTKYDVCSAFASDVYGNAFGFEIGGDQFPKLTDNLLSSAKNYYNSNKDGGLDNTFLLLYKDSTNNYVYNNTVNFSDFVQMIQPGDIFVYKGHVMVAYDKVQKPDRVDVLLLNSVVGGTINTRINSDVRKLRYKNSDLLVNPKELNEIIDIENEGSISSRWLSDVTQFVSSDSINCSSSSCAVIRPYYAKNNKAMFNYSIREKNYNQSLLRLEYPGLYIEKTVNVKNNNNVYLNDELEYTITIKNMSNTSYNPQNYGSFVIKETLGNYVTYLSSNNNGVYSNNYVTWNISNLDANKSIKLVYKVKVKKDYSNLNKVIESDGVFLKNSNSSISIATGNINNKIVQKVIKKEYSKCFNEYKNSYTGLELLDKIYSCTSNSNFDFKDFDFTNLFKRNSGLYDQNNPNPLQFNSNMNDKHKLFKNMILNDYWSGVTLMNSGSNIIALSWYGQAASRNKYIKPSDLKDGDILIYSTDYDNFKQASTAYNTPNSDRYTKENGLYAYIYIDGKFVGRNYSGNVNERNEFTYNYYTDLSKLYVWSKTSNDKLEANPELLEFFNYETLYEKDYFVILRPELLIKELSEVELEGNIGKTKYIQNKDELDLSGLVLKTVYNDGETSTIGIDDKNVNITGFNNKKLGRQIITIEYLGRKVTTEVEVVSESGGNDAIPNVVDNPQTGLFVPVVSLIALLMVSFSIMHIVKKRNKLFDI